MAEFESKVVLVKIESHPNADRLDLAKVGEYHCVVGKGTFKTGDLAAYIPEGAVVPNDVIESLGLTGILAGKQKNRVKAIRLRNVVSQGIVHPLHVGRLAPLTKLKEGDDVTEILGLVKYEPPVPMSMSGQVYSCSWGTSKFDVENYKKYPDLIPNGTMVQVTEKLHGTFCGIGYHKENGWSVFSKGIGSQGLAFKLDSVENITKNVYVKTFLKYKENLKELVDIFNRYEEVTQFFVFGEIFGKGIQDLDYGAPAPDLAIFDIYFRYNGPAHDADGNTTTDSTNGQWSRPELVAKTAELLKMRAVPVIFTGMFDPDMNYQDGKTTTDGEHIREGVVVRPVVPYRCATTGMNAMVKMVSDDYLLRKGGTEYN